jgi:hypothetical protein
MFNKFIINIISLFFVIIFNQTLSQKTEYVNCTKKYVENKFEFFQKKSTLKFNFDLNVYESIVSIDTNNLQVLKLIQKKDEEADEYLIMTKNINQSDSGIMIYAINREPSFEIFKFFLLKKNVYELHYFRYDFDEIKSYKSLDDIIYNNLNNWHLKKIIQYFDFKNQNIKLISDGIIEYTINGQLDSQIIYEHDDFCQVIKYDGQKNAISTEIHRRLNENDFDVIQSFKSLDKNVLDSIEIVSVTFSGQNFNVIDSVFLKGKEIKIYRTYIDDILVFENRHFMKDLKIFKMNSTTFNFDKKDNNLVFDSDIGYYIQNPYSNKTSKFYTDLRFSPNKTHYIASINGFNTLLDSNFLEVPNFYFSNINYGIDDGSFLVNSKDSFALLDIFRKELIEWTPNKIVPIDNLLYCISIDYKNCELRKLSGNSFAVDYIIPFSISNKYQPTINLKGKLIRVVKNDFYGYINFSENLVLPIVYEYAEQLGNYFIVQNKSIKSLIDINRKVLVDSIDFASINDDQEILIIQKHNKSGLFSNDRFLLPPIYDKIESIKSKNNAFYILTKDDKSYIFDLNLNLIDDQPIEYFERKNDSLIVYSKEGKFGVISSDFMIQPKYEGIFYHKRSYGQLIIYYSNKKMGLLSNDGQEIPFNY